jgi:hypothetical protein
VAVRNPNPFAVHNVHPLVGASWVYDVDPYERTIPANTTVDYTVTVRPPTGTTAASYDLPMALTASETGTVDTADATLRVGGTGAVIPSGGGNRSLVLLVGIGVLLLLGAVTAWQTGTLAGIREELTEL